MASSKTDAVQDRPPDAIGGRVLRRLPFPRRFDIAAKLFIAFCAIAGLTVLAAMVAWVLFAEVRRNLTLIADDSLPEIVNSFRLAQESAQLSSAITSLARATTKQDLDEEYGAVTARLDAIVDLTDVHGAHGDELYEVLEGFELVLATVRANVGRLRSNVQKKIAASRRRELLVSTLFRDHRAFIREIDPLIDAAREEMIASTRRSVIEGTAGISSLIDDSFDALRALLVVQSNIHFLIAAIYQVAATDQLARLYDLRFAIVAPIAEIKGAFNQISDIVETDELKSVASAIIDTAIGKGNIFELKKAVLNLEQDGAAAPKHPLSKRLADLDALQAAFAEVNGRAIAIVDAGVLEAATKMSQEGQTMISKTRDGVDQLETILLLKSEVNQLVGLLSQAATALEPDDIDLLRDRYGLHDTRIGELLQAVGLAASGEALRPSIQRILLYGLGGRSILAVRYEELTAQGEAAELLREGQRFASELSVSAQFFVEKAERTATETTGVTLSDLSRGEAMLVVISLISLGAVVLIGWLFVLRGIVRRLQALSETMLSLADGHLDAAIPMAKSNDEITDMGKALAVFRENAVKRREAERSLRKAKESAETALHDLKAAQRRLVQAEKMASLGQLTAGIAHEIKNPLNFVNNFASLSRELIEELRDQLKGVGDRVGPEAREEIDSIFGDLDLNLDKINEHGKRADGIVRGMLEHSRESSHSFAATDVNKLLEEYVNLAYHGMRAQNSSFNVTIERDLDQGLEPVEVVPQDIGRVFLNIITNAFQAIYHKSQEQGQSYDPKLFLATRRHGDHVEIRIRDNGPGMPEAVLAKIFQPFFTTKPTGEGTGLGLSISHDIVAQQHGGHLEANATEGEGTEFLVTLPVGPHDAAEPALQERRS